MFWWFYVTFIKEKIWKNDKSLTIFCDNSPIQFPSFTSWDRLVGNLEETHVTSRPICWVKHDKFQGIYEGNDKSGKKGTFFFKAKLRGLGFDIRSTQVKSNLLDDLHSKAPIRHTFLDQQGHLHWFHFDQPSMMKQRSTTRSWWFPTLQALQAATTTVFQCPGVLGVVVGKHDLGHRWSDKPRVPGDMLGSLVCCREKWW